MGSRLLHLGPALALLGGAAWCDVRTRRIPNALTLSLAVAGLVDAALWGGGSHLAAMGSALGGIAVSLAVLYVPFSRRWLGAGDVKLAAAAASWVGLWQLPSLLVGTALAGGGLALLALIAGASELRRRARANLLGVLLGVGPRPASARLSLRAEGGLPYGVAIAVAAAVLLLTEVHG